ncbi:MAG: DUF2750 domain-containing protein [Flavobacterium sp.]|nr:DUF2750 domain-containing protein [Flavobacterium sp.]
MYTLINKKGAYITSEIDNRFILPLWSSFDFAKNCLMGGWEECIIKEITLEEFEENVIEYISKEDYLLNVFPIYDKTGFILDIEEFIRDLNDELENYD